MKCLNCQEYIDGDSKFCQFCGHRVAQDSSTENADKLWKAFLGYSYENDPEKKAQHRKLLPENIKEICTRFATNTFESLKSEHQEIQELPFSVAENIKTYYYLSCEDGYWLFLVRRELNDEKLKNTKADINEIIDEWQKTLTDEDKYKRYFTEEFIKVFEANEGVEIDLLLKNNPQLKDLPTRVIDQIKTDLYDTTLWTYLSSEIGDAL